MIQTSRNNPIWKDYIHWEDYKKGMYSNRIDSEYVNKCKMILSSECYFAMKLVTINWINATMVNLTQSVWNNKAWLGQACCCLEVGATMFETCSAWNMLSRKEKRIANAIADQVIKEWQNENIQ